jgi:hypothetical protein
MKSLYLLRTTVAARRDTGSLRRLAISAGAGWPEDGDLSQ